MDELNTASSSPVKLVFVTNVSDERKSQNGIYDSSGIYRNQLEWFDRQFEGSSLPRADKQIFTG